MSCRVPRPVLTILSRCVYIVELLYFKYYNIADRKKFRVQCNLLGASCESPVDQLNCDCHRSFSLFSFLFCPVCRLSCWIVFTHLTNSLLIFSGLYWESCMPVAPMVIIIIQCAWDVRGMDFFLPCAWCECSVTVWDVCVNYFVFGVEWNHQTVQRFTILKLCELSKCILDKKCVIFHFNCYDGLLCVHIKTKIKI